jgi:TetR/AcrR family transcriptional regulator, fatty acid metabolism regulator protein
LTSRSTAQEEKRRLILSSAVRVFAHRGYHTSRVGDIAEEAGIAHGLLYHYFSSKEQVLETIFRENWRVLTDAFRQIEESSSSPLEQIEAMGKILLRSWLADPDLVRVMIREVARSAHLQGQVDELRDAFLIIRRVIERGQAEGQFRPELDPRLASWVFYGSLEEILTGWTLGELPHDDEDVARAERTVLDLLCGGLVVRAPVGSAADRKVAVLQREGPEPIV